MMDKQQRLKQEISIAMLKGFLHATIIPILVTVVVNYFWQGWGLIVAMVYLIIVSLVYRKVKNKDISKKVFFFSLKMLFISLVTIVSIIFLVTIVMLF